MAYETGLAGTVALVRAKDFGANPETVASNAFQAAVTDGGAAERALEEQQLLASALEDAGVRVMWLEPPRDSISPDGIFPNNWFSTHEDGRIVFYPMEAPSRRTERIPMLSDSLQNAGFTVGETLDYTAHENDGEFLEGTGSLVLDRVNCIAYAAVSTRTHLPLAQRWAGQFGYDLLPFHAVDPSGRPVYHTNVIMSLGAGLAIVCLDSIVDVDERRLLRERLEATGNAILDISWEQVCRFAGNQLFLRGRNGAVVALSAAAERSLSAAQRKLLDDHAERVSADIATIERHGGGSVRCMLAEIFLPPQQE